MNKIVLSIFVIIMILIISLSSVNATIKQVQVAELNLQMINQKIYPVGWTKLTDDGFGKLCNVAIRGMAIYKNELYVGTHNLNLSKLNLNQDININIETGLIANLYQDELYSNLVREEFITDLTQKKSLLDIVLERQLIESQKSYLQTDNLAIVNGYSTDDFDKSLSTNYQQMSYQGLNLITILIHLVNKASDGCNVYKYNYTTGQLIQIVGDESVTGMKSGFNYTFNCDASIIKVFNDKLYVGTWNTAIGSKQNPERKGCEIWRFDGSIWEQVVGHNALTKGGFGNPANVAAWSMREFDGHLYVGTMNWGFSSNSGCEIWRTQDGINWEKVVDRGFKPFMSPSDLANGTANTYAWDMGEFQEQLYVGTFNLKMFSSIGWGCQLWRTYDGLNWNKVNLPSGDGFGEPENYGIRKLVIYNDELYISAAAHILQDEALEIWKFDGTDWIPVIGDDVPGVKEGDIEYDGFGNPMNKYAWSMAATSDNKLWVGTGNLKMTYIGGLYSEGCEIWYYNGNEWTPVVKDGYEKPNGFGNEKNQAARSMIEYPEGSGNIVVGTLRIATLSPKTPQEGCDLWIRIS